jgi:hypothetical protein
MPSSESILKSSLEAFNSSIYFLAADIPSISSLPKAFTLDENKNIFVKGIDIIIMIAIVTTSSINVKPLLFINIS